MVVLFFTTTLLAVATPNVTIAPAANFVPVIVTAVPPLAPPVVGLMDETVAPTVGAVPPVVKLQIGPVEIRLAIVLETIFHRYAVLGASPEML
jgi:hypothetical protein